MGKLLQQRTCVRGVIQRRVCNKPVASQWQNCTDLFEPEIKLVSDAAITNTVTLNTALSRRPYTCNQAAVISPLLQLWDKQFKISSKFLSLTATFCGSLTKYSEAPQKI